jgi:hypothetical protein
MYVLVSKEAITRPYEKGDEEEIVRLLQTVFVGWPKFDLQCSSLDHWKWKYLDNPLKLNAVALAEYDGKLVGCNHGVYSKLKMGDKSLLAQQGGDLAIEKDFRGMKLLPKMQEVKDKLAYERKANIGYSLSNHPIVLRGELRSRLQFPHNLKHKMKIKDIEHHLKMAESPDFRNKISYNTLNMMNRINKLFTSIPDKKTKDIEIERINEFGENIDVFWSKVKGRYNFIFERDRSFLNWRYCDKRGGNFIINQASEGENIVGYSVIRINKLRKEYPVGFVADLITLPNRLDVSEILLKEIDEHLSKQKVNIIHSIAITGNIKDKLLIKHGYLTYLEKYYLLYSPYDLGNEHDVFIKSTPNRLHFEYGDLDWI